MPIFSSKPGRALKSGVAPALLASTCVAALLLGVPARAGQAITTPQASVTNPAGHATTSIVITGTTVTGAVTNAGTITPGTIAGGGGLNTGTALAVINSSVGGGITNSGVISVNGGNGIFVQGSSTVSGGITNTGAINVTITGSPSIAAGIFVESNNTVSGGITNSGTINASLTGINIGFFSTVSGGIINTGTINANFRQGIVLFGSMVSGGISNTGTINVNGAGIFAEGILVQLSTVSGNVTNGGTITVTGSTSAIGISVAGSVSGAVANTGAITANAATKSGGIVVGSTTANLATPGTISGGIANSGSIAVSASAHATGILVNAGSTVSGGIANSGKITASSPAGVAIGIGLGVTNAGAAGAAATITGGVSNSGTITANGKTGIGIAVSGNTPISGGITNTGTIRGSTAAISLAGETGVSNTVTQAGGALVGNIIGSGNAKGDVLNVTGGTIVLSGGQSISGFGTYNQTGGILAFNVTQSTAPGTYPTVSAGTINLRGGTLELLPAPSSLNALATQHTTVFKNAIVADPPLSGSFANITTPISLFSASLSPDATTANALDATLALSQAGLAVSAQDLTQSAQLGLDAPRVLTQAVQDRLVANGGALGESASANAGQKGVGVAGFSLGNANVWARGYDQFGSASGMGAAPGYDINRAAPFIGGVDWRFDNNVVAGVAATYVATSASFKDGSRTNVSSYQGAAYAGWAGGPWYALGSTVVSFNEFGTSRLLTPFGLPGNAASSPSGQSYQGHAEGGYHWVLAAGGTNVSVTPYAALDYVNAHISGFSETGGFGALSVNTADSNSFQTTLGVRLTSRIQMANMGTLTPELRLGWSHEFLDASQSLTAALVGVPGSAFSATGIAFGRDAALIGVGVSMELSPDAKVFVDYDGRVGSRLQEHSVSGGLKLRF